MRHDAQMRVHVDLPEKMVRELDRIARHEGRSRASLIRKAIDAYLKVHGTPAAKRPKA